MREGERETGREGGEGDRERQTETETDGQTHRVGREGTADVMIFDIFILSENEGS